MSIPFFSCFTSQNRSKNELATSKGSKVTLLGPDKERKIRKIKISGFFVIYFMEKKIQIGPPEVSIPVYKFEYIF